MTELFNLAAQVKLSHRLNNLLRINETIEIDMSYITCAEYQLFIDQKRASGKNIQPDHWTTDRFPSGAAKIPITGVRASDAEAFCQWLTEQKSVSGFQYRLPTSTEIEEYPLLKQQVGSWCTDGKIRVILGIKLEQWQIWRRKLTALRNRALDCALDHALDRAFDRALDRALARTCARAFALDLALARALAHDPDCAFDRALGLAHALDRELTFDLDRALDRALDLARDLDFARVRAVALAHDRARARARDRDRSIARDRARARTRDRNFTRVLAYAQTLARSRSLEQDYSSICFYLLQVFSLWALLADIYDRTSKNQKVLQDNSLTREKCNALNRDCTARGDECFSLYTFFLLVDLRRQGKMPAWEGIRIVRERVE